jgi:hypothetical protein
MGTHFGGTAPLFDYYTHFSWSHAPLSSSSSAAGAVLGYLILVALLSAHMRGRDKPYALISKYVLAMHNVILSAGSLLMFMGCLVEVASEYSRQGGASTWFFCHSADGSSRPSGGPLFFWSYIYYLSKFYELLDTVFVLLRKSTVPHFGMQVFHHAGVIPMCWLWLETRQSLQFGGLLFNTLVHIVMYWYYALQALGYKQIWWKRYITHLQIVQFLTSLVLFAWSLYLVLGKGQRCNGFHAESYYSIWYNVVFNLTLLYAFMGVSKANAKRGRATEDKAK